MFTATSASASWTACRASVQLTGTAGRSQSGRAPGVTSPTTNIEYPLFERDAQDWPRRSPGQARTTLSLFDFSVAASLRSCQSLSAARVRWPASELPVFRATESMKVVWSPDDALERACDHFASAAVEAGCVTERMLIPPPSSGRSPRAPRPPPRWPRPARLPASSDPGDPPLSHAGPWSGGASCRAGAPRRPLGHAARGLDRVMLREAHAASIVGTRVAPWVRGPHR